MVGKTPAKYQAIRPLKDGVIADFKLAEAMIRHFVGLQIVERVI
jgi:rod shape-determining protein MreB